jgi:hypothetical protein
MVVVAAVPCGDKKGCRAQDAGCGTCNSRLLILVVVVLLLSLVH